MNSVKIDRDISKNRSHPFLRRRLMDAAMLHLIDGIMLFLAMWLGDFILYLVNGIPVQMAPILLMIPCWWAGTWVAHLVPGWGMGVVEELRRLELLLLFLFMAALVVLFLQRDAGISRITFLGAYLVSTISIPLGRVFARKLLAKWGVWGIPVVIYGTQESAPTVADVLSKDHSLGFIPHAVLSDDFEVGDTVKGLPVLGGVQFSDCHLPVAVVAMPELKRGDLIRLLEGPLENYKTILLVPDLRNAPSLWVKPCDLQGILALELKRNLLDPVSYFFKAVVEQMLVLVSLPIWGSLCLILMAIIRLRDGGSPVYAQERVGVKNRKFKAYKLRTMIPDAERVLEKKLTEDVELKEEWETHYKLRNDPRITGIGNFLRKTSLDELPQLWCVMTGTMALVGPRPLPAYHHGELKARTQRLRVKVKPGVTGLWQVSGRSDSGTKGMDRWDTYYVTNWSIWLDLIIVARTVRVVLLGKGAY